MDVGIILTIVTAVIAGASALGVFIKALFDRLSARIESIEKKHGDCTAENAVLRESTATLKAENKYQAREIEDLRAEVQELRSELEDVRSQIREDK
jgi:chromosome segregation ATPase